MTDNNTGDQNTGDYNTGDYNTGYQNTGHWNTGNWNTGEYNTGDYNTGDQNTGDQNTGHQNTGDQNTGHQNTGHQNTGHQNTGHRNTGNWNTGNWNTGNYNTGYFNNTTPETIRVFGKDCIAAEWYRAEKPYWIYEPKPTTWVLDIDMTDQEKIDNPTFHTCGGYLRVNDWKEEWRKAYECASDDDIQKVRDLPNFDYDIFEDITGLDIRPNDKATCEGKTVEIDGVEYVLKRK